MATLLNKFGAIESRIASYSCPAGTPGRVQALRLRRCFQRPARLHATLVDHQPVFNDLRPPVFEENFQEEHLDVPATPPQKRALEDRISKLLEVRRRYSHSETMWDPYKYGDLFRSTNQSMPLQIAGPGEVATPVDDIQHSLEPAHLFTQLQISLRSGDPHQLLEIMLRHIKAVGPLEYAKSVLSTIPAATFSEILYTLDPKHFFGDLSKLLQEVSSTWAVMLRLPPVNDNGYHELSTLFLRHISTIIYSREAVYPLSISDYKFLLKCTRVTGNTSAAQFIWRKMNEDIRKSIAAARHIPNSEVLSADVECYNHYVATLCWAEMPNPLQRHRLRIVPKNYVPRMWEDQHFVPLRGHSVGASGIKAIVASNFRVMVKQKLQPNEETFSLMIVSVGRERDLTSISGILKRVWGVDVAAVMGTSDDAVSPTRAFRQSDPLYPTNRLLMAIAHAYSVNNSISTAIRLVDFVARQYNITISQDVWSELLERTFIMTAANTTTGQLPLIAVENLWNTMTSEPYNIQPNMKMYNHLIKCLIRRQAFGQAQLKMTEAMEVHHADVRKLGYRINILNKSDPDEVPVHLIGQRARDLSYHHLRVKINRQYIRRWVDILITRAAKDMRRNEDFAAINIPNIIRDYATFLPDIVRYRTGTGVVELNSHSRRLNRIAQEGRMERNRQTIKFQFGWTGHNKGFKRVGFANSRIGRMAARRKKEATEIMVREE